MAFAFGTPIPDRLNMLQPGHNGPGGANNHDAVLKADNINQWTIYNTLFGGGSNAVTVTLGAMVTAPDGTNTGQRIVETTTNSIHGLQAITQPGAQNSALSSVPWHVERLAVIAKADQRTRIALVISDYLFPNSGAGTPNGVQAVFDLAGGQVGVPAAVFGPGTGLRWAWQAVGSNITALSGGWYLCTLDAIIGDIAGGIGPTSSFLIDNGSGLAAQSTVYAGDVTKGILTWRASMLPPRAWALTDQIFFEDFNDLSTIDLASSLAPGFNWYINGKYPLFGVDPITPSQLSVNSSILKFDVSPSNHPQEMFSINYGPGPFSAGQFPWVGTVWTVPMLMESSWAWNTTPVPSFTASFWTTDAVKLGTVLDTTTYPPSGWPTGMSGVEVDIFENSAAPAGYTPFISISNLAAPPFSAGFQGGEEKFKNTPLDVYPVWIPSNDYFSHGGKVFWQGNWYQSSSAGSNIGNQPPNASFWTPISAPVPNLVVDFSQQHVYSLLWIPYVGPNDFGQILHFFDGMFAGGICYGPSAVYGQGSTLLQAGDNLFYPIFLQGGNNYAVFIDWVSVYGPPQSNLGSLTVRDSSATARPARATSQ